MAGWAYQSVSFYLGRCSLQRHCNSHFIGRHVEKSESAFHFLLQLAQRVFGDNV